MSEKIVIGTPPLGEQTHPVMVGGLKSGGAVIQTDNGWITIDKEHLGGTADALFTVFGDNIDKKISSVQNIGDIRNAIESIWDGITDILSQADIDKIERLYRKEFDLVFDSSAA